MKTASGYEVDFLVVGAFALRRLAFPYPGVARHGAANARMTQIVELHDHIRQEFAEFLDSDMGSYLTPRFAAFS